jgi:hypothetical protein
MKWNFKRGGDMPLFFYFFAGRAPKVIREVGKESLVIDSIEYHGQVAPDKGVP